jgi:hypothetical protein
MATAFDVGLPFLDTEVRTTALLISSSAVDTTSRAAVAAV